MNLIYNREEKLSVEEFVNVLNESGLGERRPVDDKDRIAKMVANANLIITARYKGKLIGVARALTDFTYCTYLSDLAVKVDFQKRGVGKELIKLTYEASKPAKLILLSAPAAVDYYPKIGMEKHNYCYILSDIVKLK
ncbi:MAG: GNAT family N-acetyltransferase [Melioribacteraceae bacterium]|jgi:ribosomal protein S18 acetylase RimI-like enzyme|nr:GNAT family N-acetyltransferase [Melioribacteraceae bacterium]